MHRRIVVGLSLVLLSGCATPRGAASPSLERLFAVCWPRDAAALQTVTLDFSRPDDVGFEVANGATNSTARCMREIALSVPPAARPAGTVAVSPAAPANGWAVLAWVQQVSVGGAGGGGITDPAPKVAGCLSLDGGIRAGLKVATVGPTSEKPRHREYQRAS